MRLQGKNALVTGAASGFGREIARRFAAEGARVAVVDVNVQGARTVAREIGEAAIAITCDVADGKQVRAAAREAIETFGRLDIVINNAGWSHRNQPLLDVDEETFRKVYAINVDSIFHMTHAVVPHWREQGGGVMINVGSTAGHTPASGAGLVQFHKGRGEPDDAGAGGRTRARPYPRLRPGAGDGRDRASGNLHGHARHPGKPREIHRDHSPGRLCEPRDMANSALFLASDEAEFLTGVILEVDGGRTI